MWVPAAVVAAVVEEVALVVLVLVLPLIVVVSVGDCGVVIVGAVAYPAAMCVRGLLRQWGLREGTAARAVGIAATIKRKLVHSHRSRARTGGSYATCSAQPQSGSVGEWNE